MGVENVAQTEYNSELWYIKIRSRTSVFVQMIKPGILGGFRWKYGNSQGEAKPKEI